MPRLTSVTHILGQSGWARFSLVFLIILVLKWNTLLQPPVWDTAMGLFPPALTLAENGFDLLELLGMPGYEEGGPNAHSTSLVTLATAVVLWTSGGGTRGFLILHLLHFAGAALALLTLFRLVRPMFGGVTTLLLCASVLLHPVFSTQVGYLYTEMPLFLFTVLALPGLDGAEVLAGGALGHAGLCDEGDRDHRPGHPCPGYATGAARRLRQGEARGADRRIPSAVDGHSCPLGPNRGQPIGGLRLPPVTRRRLRGDRPVPGPVPPERPRCSGVHRRLLRDRCRLRQADLRSAPKRAPGAVGPGLRSSRSSSSWDTAGCSSSSSCSSSWRPSPWRPGSPSSSRATT